MRQISAGTSFKSQEPDEGHFGLADAVQADVVEVTWPDGSTTTRTNVPVNRLVFIGQASGDCVADGNLDSADFGVLEGCLSGPLGTSLEGVGVARIHGAW